MTGCFHKNRDIGGDFFNRFSGRGFNRIFYNGAIVLQAYNPAGYSLGSNMNSFADLSEGHFGVCFQKGNNFLV